MAYCYTAKKGNKSIGSIIIKDNGYVYKKVFRIWKNRNEDIEPIEFVIKRLKNKIKKRKLIIYTSNANIEDIIKMKKENVEFKFVDHSSNPAKSIIR